MSLNLWCQSLMKLNRIYQVNSNSINLKIKKKKSGQGKLVEKIAFEQRLKRNERRESYTTGSKNFPAGRDLVHPKTKDLLQAHPRRR